MKFKDFRNQMRKTCFTIQEAYNMAWPTPLQVLRLQLHQWTKKGELIRLRRGIYAFGERSQNLLEVAQALYAPSYLSLEKALHDHGFIPDVVFALTLVTTRTTRRFQTPMGHFIYHHIQPCLFWGYDPDSGLAEGEKAFMDYFYLYHSRLQPKRECWEALRLQNLSNLNFKKLKDYAKRTGMKKILELAISLESYGKD
ncbi:MAG: hypothetical protein HYS07_08500 [Chlamydiae bacterium]|nr:hypothetical protein [Chlamydiota bacterium]MBI3276413.1 hypothetical protein [Chlamydiota bacterium]